MNLTLGQITRLLDGELEGDPDITVSGVAGIKDAGPGDLTFLANPRYSGQLASSRAACVIAGRGITTAAMPVIRVDDPSLAFAKAAGELLGISRKRPSGIHSLSFISPGARIAKNAVVGAFCVIEEGVTVGAGTVIYPGSYLGYDVCVGSDCLIYPGVRVRERVSIGDRVVIHCGAVIGSDGFGFAQDDTGNVKIPQVGTVVIEDDVEIGANVTIDRARFDKTIIGKGTKIDNLVQIAHNVVTGKDCIIVAQVGIAGSSRLGDKVVLAGQAGVAGHITLSDGVRVAAQAGVFKSFGAGITVSGTPARELRQAQRVNACLHDLPELFKKVRALEEKAKKQRK